VELSPDSGEVKLGEFGCIEGRTKHEFKLGVCKWCGIDEPKSTPKRRGRPPGSRNSTTQSRGTSTVQPSVSQKDAREGMAFVILLLQKVLIMRVPDLKPDELSPLERQILAAAITEELYESSTVRRLLTQLNNQKKHAKLSLALMVILLPRLKRHGIIPEEMDLEELTGELASASIRQSASDSSVRPSAGPTNEQTDSWDSVSVAAGGSPFSDRGNGFGQIDPSGVAPETAPLRSDPPHENGRYSVAGARGGEEPSSVEELKTEPYRATTGSKTGGSEEG
jgi:hypothetical protein